MNAAYQRLFGVSTEEEEQERLAARQNILDALERLAELDRETAEKIAEEACLFRGAARRAALA